MIGPPPKWVRRLLIAPAVVLLAVVMVPTTLMFMLVVGAALTWVLPGRLRAVRVLWMAAFYIVWDAAALLALFALWIASGFGLAMNTPWCRTAHVGLARRMLSVLFWQVRWTLRLRIVTDGPGLDLPAGPELVLSRHAGPGDSFILVHQVLQQGRTPSIVLKDSLQWDPAIDVLLNRLPSAFVGRRRRGRPSTRATIARISAGLGPEGALVLFPEGGNVTPGRRTRRIQALRDSGQPELAARAEAMPHVMPPIAGGFLTAADACPEAEILVVAHTGLEKLVTVRDIWRELPMDKTITLGYWRHAVAELPADDAGREAWLFDQWVLVDAWINERSPA